MISIGGDNEEEKSNFQITFKNALEVQKNKKRYIKKCLGFALSCFIKGF